MRQKWTLRALTLTLAAALALTGLMPVAAFAGSEPAGAAASTAQEAALPVEAEPEGPASQAGDESAAASVEAEAPPESDAAPLPEASLPPQSEAAPQAEEAPAEAAPAPQAEEPVEAAQPAPAAAAAEAPAAPAAAEAEVEEAPLAPQDAPASVTVTLRVEAVDKTYLPREELTIAYRPLIDYGIVVDNEPGFITPLHVLAEGFAHSMGLDGDPDTLATTGDYLSISRSGYFGGFHADLGMGPLADGNGASYYWSYNLGAKSLEDPNRTDYEYNMNEYPVVNGDNIAITGVWEGSYMAGISAYISFFEQESYTVEAGEPFSMALKGYRFYDFPKVEQHAVGNAELLAVKAPTSPSDPSGPEAAESQHRTGVTTNAAGVAYLSFDEAGTYLVSAYRKSIDQYDITRPYAVVTVTDSDPADDQSLVDADKAALSLPDTAMANLSLPATGESGKTAITWVSGTPAVLSSTGVVTRPNVGSSPVDVILTATIKKRAATAQKQLTVRVEPLTAEELNPLLDQIEAAFGTSHTANFEGPSSIDQIFRARAQAVAGEAQVTLVGSENPQVDSTGAISYGPEAKTGKVTLKVALSGAEREIEVMVTVPAGAQAFINSMAAAIGWEAIKGDNTAAGAVTKKLSLPRGNSYTYTVAWVSSNPDVVSSSGAVTRPAYGQADASVTLNATVSATAYTSMMGYVGTASPKAANPITLTVPAITQAEYNAAQLVVDGIKSDMEQGGHRIVYIGDEVKTAVPLDAVVNDLSFSEADSYTADSGATIVWSSTNPAIAVNHRRGKVTRPARGDAAATGTLTATITKQGATASVVYSGVTVPAVTQAELDAEGAFLQRVADALSFDLIKKDNTDARYVHSGFSMVYRAVPGANGELSFGSSNRGEVGAVIEWTSSHNGTEPYKVTRPAFGAQPEAATLTATISSQVLRYGAIPSVSKTIDFTIQPKSNRLFGLTADAGRLSPAFTPDATGYTLSGIAWNADTVLLGITPDPAASVVVSGAVEENGRYRMPAEDGGILTVGLTCQGSTNTYTVKLRKDAPPASDPGVSTAPPQPQPAAEPEAQEETVAVSEVRVTPAAKTLQRGKTATLKAAVSPANASDKRVEWASSRPGVVSVDANGRLRAIKNGSAVITARALDGSGALARVSVKVGGTAVKKVTLSQSSKTLKAGRRFGLKATVSPADATFKGVSWASSNEAVATVDSRGRVRAIARGRAVITATSKDGAKKARCTVRVK